MKITRLKRGYRIRLTDAEFAALNDAHSRGTGDYELLTDDEWDDMDPDIVKGLTTTTGRGSWHIADDRRRTSKDAAR